MSVYDTGVIKKVRRNGVTFLLTVSRRQGYCLCQQRWKTRKVVGVKMLLNYICYIRFHLVSAILLYFIKLYLCKGYSP